MKISLPKRSVKRFGEKCSNPPVGELLPGYVAAELSIVEVKEFEEHAKSCVSCHYFLRMFFGPQAQRP
jgi:putative zinc finger protein